MSQYFYLNDSRFSLVNRYLVNIRCIGSLRQYKTKGKEYFLAGIEGKSSRLIALFWIVLYSLIALVIVGLFYYWFVTEKLSISDIFMNPGIILIILAVLSALLGFLMPALNYLNLLFTKVRFSNTNITILSAGIKDIILRHSPKFYTWEDIKSMKRGFIDRSQYKIIFKDGTQLLLPHWPQKNINKFLACVLKHKPNLAWIIELYLRGIYAGGAV